MEIQCSVDKTGKEPIMFKRTSIVLVMAAIVVLVATWAMLGTAVAQKAAVPKPRKNLALEMPRSSNCSCLWIPTRTVKSRSKNG